MKFWPTATSCALVAARLTGALELDLQDTDSIKQAASTIAFEMVSHYYGNTTEGIPGVLGDPYYWWEAGAMFSSLIDYWYYTGDEAYNEITMQAMMHQRGERLDYEPRNHSKSLGNDDQAFWGMAAMTAAECGFEDPGEDEPGWLALAQAVFNRQQVRWADETCNGGLRWQIFPMNNGYNYKNSITQGSFMNIAARLYAYTGNETYAEWATKAYDWSEEVGLISPQYQVFDGTDELLDCREMNHIQWSYNTGVYMAAAASMYNMTTGETQEKWRTAVEGLVRGARVFFYEDTNVMFEIACEPRENCNVDQLSFKAYLSRWMAHTIKLAPFTHDTLLEYIQTSSTAAADSCSGGDRGVTCGTKWYVDGWDGTYGVGQQMNALEIIQSNLIDQVAPPLRNSTGGTSRGNPSAGTGPESSSGGGGGGGGGRGRHGSGDEPITTGDRAGAGILTALVIIFFLGGAWWMVA